MYGELFFLDVIFDFTPDEKKGKRYAVQMSQRDIFDNVNKLHSKKNIKYYKAILKKMLESQYINLDDKKYLQEKMDKLNSIYTY